jgi:quercetin dioxygenase-like cupin family protein
MPIEIRRFGVGHRRPDGPPGTVGVKGQVIHSDGRGTISEVAFARDARVEPHASPNTTWMVVIEGGGWVALAGERTRVAAGEAVLWPADVIHAAWTEHSEMRAIVVEFAGPDDAAVRGLVDAPVRDGGTDRRLLDPPVFGVAMPLHPEPPRDEPRDGEPA